MSEKLFVPDIGEFENVEVIEILVKVGDNIKFEKTYKLSLKNNKEKSVSIVLIDQIPKSTKKSIDIQLVESSEAIFDKKNGKLKWNIQLSPNEIIEKKFSFTVKHPSETKVSGF